MDFGNTVLKASPRFSEPTPWTEERCRKPLLGVWTCATLKASLSGTFLLEEGCRKPLLRVWTSATLRQSFAFRHLPQSWPRREAGNVWCPPSVWNLRAVIWFPFPISSLVFSSFLLSFFCLALLLFLSCQLKKKKKKVFANGPFSRLFSLQKTQMFFVKG